MECVPMLHSVLMMTENKMKPDYEKAYDILMEYWDSLPDEEKESIDLRLKLEAGL